MNSTIINNYNLIVQPEDEFYFLGDFCMGDHSKAENYLKQLVPNPKYFISGNHDKRSTIELYKKYGTYLGKMAEIVIEKTPITLCHYAMRIWNHSHHGAYHLYGHSHGSLPEDPNSLSFDVGTNCSNYKPISWNTVKVRMAKKTFKPIDHHDNK